MAEVTKQFLTGKVRSRDYDKEEILLSVFRHRSPKNGVATTVTMHSLDDQYRVQRLFLSEDETRTLVADLLNSISNDSELLAVFREALLARKG